MQTLGGIFDCDAKACDASLVSYGNDLTSAYIAAARAGWMPKENRASGRRQVFCPNHKADAEVPTP